MMFARVIGKYLNKPFSECTCLGFLKNVYDELGLYFPYEYGGWNIDNYMDFFRQDSDAALDLMIDFFSTIGNRVPRNKIMARDLLVVRHRDGVRFPAICIGKRQAVSSFLRVGVKSFPLDEKSKPIMARRLEPCRQQSQQQ